MLIQWLAQIEKWKLRTAFLCKVPSEVNEKTWANLN
jgi:hypothetical protein